MIQAPRIRGGERLLMPGEAPTYVPSIDRRNELPDFAGLIPRDFTPPSDRVRSEPKRNQAWVAQFGVIGLCLVLGWMTLAVLGVVSLTVSMIGMFGGSAVFSLALFIANRFGQPVWISESLSARLFLASVGLACTVLVAGLTK
jgi:hypothetical protein